MRPPNSNAGEERADRAGRNAVRGIDNPGSLLDLKYMGERSSNAPLRLLAQQAFSRVAGAPLIAGNQVKLLIDARAKCSTVSMFM